LPRAFSELLPVKAVLTLFDWLKFLLMLPLNGRPQILHLNSVFDYFGMLRDIPYLLMARLFGFACLVKTHGSNERLIQDRRAMVALTRRLYLDLASAITFLSPAETSELRDAFPGHAHKFHTAKNIVVGGTRRGQPKEPGSVLFAGRFVGKKNIPALLRAVAALVDEGSGVNLRLAGDGPLRSELEALARQLQVEHRVRFLGWLEREALLEQIATSELVIFCSHGSEGMPMVILETLRTDSLLVAAPQRFTESYDLRPCGTIYLEDDSSEQIAAGIMNGLGRGVSADELQARDMFMLNFSPQRVCAEFVALYGSLLDSD
jgi:glycosyltransferase involved in cell wall biosynthesis